jgi:folate-binding protein YgfZ
MPSISPFCEAPTYTPREWREDRGVRLAALFRPPGEEYAAAHDGAVLFDRSDRGLLAVTGTDRKSWLNNLVTNAVKTLAEGAGAYAFATNVKGRILFDLNILALPEALWLDLDLAACAAAAAHFDRHLITEDVKIVDASGQYAHLECLGPRAAALAAQLGVTILSQLDPLAHIPLPTGETRLVWNDLLGRPGFKLFLPRGEAAATWEQLVRHGATPAGYNTLDVLRLEAGRPWPGRDLDETVLPPETGQVERAINYRKGCYLGQEVIERMRVHGALAKRLVRLRVPDGAGVPLPVAVRRDNLEVGQITSLVRHPTQPYWLGLGYLKTAITGFADLTAGDPPQPVMICTA